MRDLKKHLEALHGPVEKTRCSFYIDRELNKQFQIKCAEQEVKLSDKIAELIRDYLNA